MNNSKDSDDIHQKTEDILKRIQEQMKLSNDVLNSDSYKRTNTFIQPRPVIKENQNIIKIKDSSLEFVNIDKEFVKKPKDSIFDDICSICSSKIYYEKYLCIICKDCILCPNCEANHIHPVIKWKNSQLTSLDKIYSFMTDNNKSIQGELLEKHKPTYEFKLKSYNNELVMKPNEKMELPINIVNLNKFDVNCKKIKLVLFGRNVKDLVINNKEIEGIIKKGDTLKTKICIQTGNYKKNYNFNICLYSTENIIIEFNTLDFKLKVTDDNIKKEIKAIN